MSLRAIKKCESQLCFSVGSRQNLFKKSTCTHQRRFASNGSSGVSNNSTHNPFHSLEQQHLLLGSTTHSNPEFYRSADQNGRVTAAHAQFVRTKSESDVSALLKSCTENVDLGLISAKSNISSHSYKSNNIKHQRRPISNPSSSNTRELSKTFSGARSHHDITHSTFAASCNGFTAPVTRRRLSDCSMNCSAGGFSRQTSAMSSSELPIVSTAMDINGIVRVPIIGYEVIEERARFTVYKLRVENPLTNDYWLVLRRYTDFVRLNAKLKQFFPHIQLILPRKKIFGDNFNSVFLDNRVQRLQIFVNSLMTKVELRMCPMVRDFFCLDEPPSYSESMEECRAIFEAHEETITHLKMQITSKNDVIFNLQQKLREETIKKEQLKDALKCMSLTCPRCNSPVVPTSN